MTAASRNAEFAAGTGTRVVVDVKRYVHKNPDCESIGDRVGEYPTERIARAAIPGVKACKTCR